MKLQPVTGISPAERERVRNETPENTNFVFQPIHVWFFNRGVQCLFRFPNGYGANLSAHDGSYGRVSEALFEIALVRFKGDNSFEIVYDEEPLLGGVAGWKTIPQINELLVQINTKT